MEIEEHPNRRQRPNPAREKGRCRLFGVDVLTENKAEEVTEMLLKTVYQWDIKTEENLAAFAEESGNLHQQVRRTIYRHNVNSGLGPNVEPYGSREEFLDWLAQDIEDCQRHRETPQYEGHGIVVKAIVEHRNGKAVRAEFLQTNGVLLPHLPEPNRGGILTGGGNQQVGYGYFVEGHDGTIRFDQELHHELTSGDYPSDEGYQAVTNAMERLLQKDIDDQDKILKEDLLEIIGASEKACEYVQRNRLAQRLTTLNQTTQLTKVGPNSGGNHRTHIG